MADSQNKNLSLFIISICKLRYLLRVFFRCLLLLFGKFVSLVLANCSIETKKKVFFSFFFSTEPTMRHTHTICFFFFSNKNARPSTSALWDKFKKLQTLCFILACFSFRIVFNYAFFHITNLSGLRRMVPIFSTSHLSHSQSTTNTDNNIACLPSRSTEVEAVCVTKTKTNSTLPFSVYVCELLCYVHLPSTRPCHSYRNEQRNNAIVRYSIRPQTITVQC